MRVRLSSDDTSVNEKIIKEILKQRLAGYKIPKQIFLYGCIA